MSTSDTTIQIGIRELRENLTNYMRQVQGGASIHITSHDKVIAEFPLPPPASVRPRRVPGTLKGKIWIEPNFDDTPRDMIDTIHEPLVAEAPP